MPSAFSNWPGKALRWKPCTSAGVPNVYVAPGAPVIAAALNGVLLPQGAAAPEQSYTAAGAVIRLNFSTESGDRIDALGIF